MRYLRPFAASSQLRQQSFDSDSQCKFELDFFGGDTLELAFDSKELRSICESEDYAKQQLSALVVEALKHRLADLRAAISIKDLIAGKIRPLDNADQRIIVDLCEGYQLIFCANHPRNPLLESGNLDWSRVSRIKILGIKNDYV